jgi:hypothetical protein
VVGELKRPTLVQKKKKKKQIHGQCGEKSCSVGSGSSDKREKKGALKQLPLRPGKRTKRTPDEAAEQEPEMRASWLEEIF